MSLLTPINRPELFRRLKFYGFGFLLGCFIVSIIYKGRSCQMPGSAKMEELRWQKMEYTNPGTCMMQCRHITEDEIKEVVGKEKTAGKGKINYDVSKVHDKPFPTYAIEGHTKSGKNLRIVLADCDTVSRLVTVIDLRKQTDSCDCK